MRLTITTGPVSNYVLGAMVLLTMGLAAVLVPAAGLHFPRADWVQPSVVCAGLAAAAVYYHRRRVPSFVLCLKALIVLVSFSTAFSVLTYAVAALGRPLADNHFDAADAWLGFSAPAVVGWVNSRPWLAGLLWVAYFSVIPQTVFAIVYLGLKNRRAALDSFLLRFMIAGLLTTVCFYLLPALGTCVQYKFGVPTHYQMILDHLHALRTGTRTLATWRDAEGLIVFPSFHAIWGLLLLLAFLPDRWLRWPMIVLNTLMIAATIPVGMHYLSDVIGGTAVCAIVIRAQVCAVWILRRSRRACAKPSQTGAKARWAPDWIHGLRPKSAS